MRSNRNIFTNFFKECRLMLRFLEKYNHRQIADNIGWFRTPIFKGRVGMNRHIG